MTTSKKKLGPKAKTAGTPTHPLDGVRAPAVKAMSDLGREISTAGLKGKKVVLYFYPKDMTSGCTQQACDFQTALPKFKKIGSVVIGVSKDSIESHKKFREKYGLEFDLVADVKGEFSEKFGVWKEKSMYGRKYMGIERTTFLIDETGKVRQVFPKVKVTDHVAAVLEALKF